ncbi:MAG: response regulator [Deltaproteobacteria bacterium]|nr:response regulator [Deltaproteobacteria bacterium]
MQEIKKILVADKSPVIHKAIDIALEGLAFEVQKVKGGQEALQLAQQWRPDLILADSQLPEGNGYFLSKAVKSSPHLRSTYVVLLQTLEIGVDPKKLQECRADDVLAKPFNISSLLKTLDRLFSSHPKQKSDRSHQSWDSKILTEIDIDDEISELSHQPHAHETNKIAHDNHKQPMSQSIVPQELERSAQYTIEKICWEVVPSLSEKIIREEIDKLIKKNK